MANSEKSCQTIAKNIYLYKVKTNNPYTIEYYVECSCLANLLFQMNFEGSANFNIIKECGTHNSSPEYCLEVIAPPFKKTFLGKLTIKDPTSRAILKMSYSWSLNKDLDVITHDQIKIENEKIEVSYILF
jgi:hypothetical protein